MKTSILIITLLITLNLYSKDIDTLKLSTQIKDVTVFFDGAQVTREVKRTIPKGKYIFIIDNLPAEINPQSIQIDNNQKGEILSVKHDIIFPTEKSQVVLEYENKIKLQKIKLQKTINEIAVYDLEEKLLLDNSILNTKGEGSSISDIKEASAFYRIKLNEIKQNKLNLSIEAELIRDEILNLYLELNKTSSMESKKFSRISFSFQAESQINAQFNISYYISSAGWSPTYDFRVNNINDPLSLVYNANIYQSTGEDWNNIKLTLSTNRPSLSNFKPELETWFVERRNNYPTKAIASGESSIMGGIFDKETGDPVPFANIVILKNGEMIAGTTTDFDGKYSIRAIQSGHYDMRITYIGYETLEMRSVVLQANKVTFQDFNLQVSSLGLQTFTTINYKVPLIEKDAPFSGSTYTFERENRMPSRSAESEAKNVGSTGVPKAVEVVYFVDGHEASTNITSLEYKIDIPYSIPSDGIDYSVKIKEVKITVNYIYKCVPKLDKDVFLIAEISDWSKLHLLSGKSSIYYNGIFTGQSEIDVHNLKDTLTISLNRDKNILVERTMLKEKNEKQFIGNNIKETLNWSITVKNNRNTKITVIIEDQFPISENKSIVIEKLETSNGQVNDKTGKIIWILELEPNEKKDLTLKYSVRYPNSLKLQLE